jgi:hypothetical protein
MVNLVHSRKLYAKAVNLELLLKLYRTVDVQSYQSQIFMIPNPVT